MTQGYGGPPQQGYGPPGNAAPQGHAPPPAHPPPAKKTMGPGRIALNVVGAVVIGGLAVIGLRQVLQPSTTPAGTQVTGNAGLGGVLGAVVRAPQVITDEEIAVSANGWQMRGFTLLANRSVQVVAEGKTNADKGFSLFVIPSSEQANFEKGASFKHASAFEGLKVRSFGHTDTLPAGTWTVAVKNSENLFNTMVVHLRIVIDPS